MEKEKVYISNVEDIKKERNDSDSSYEEQGLPATKSVAEKKLFRKINYTFVPFVTFILFNQFLDKSILSTAGALTLFEDTHIDRTQFSWLGSIFYLGFLVMQPINNYLLQRLPTSKYVGTVLVLWGASLACTALAKNFSQLAGLRFLLGFFEAITYPSMFLLVSSIYRRSEQVIFFGIMFMSNGVASMVGNLVSYGIAYMPTVGDITPWKWAMIIFGCATTLTGITYFLFLPDTPYSRWFRLTEEEEKIVEERVRDNAVSRLYCYSFIALFINLQNGALTTFGTIIITDLGFSSKNAILLNIPFGAVLIILDLIFINISKRKSEIIYVAIAACVVSMIGIILLAAIPSGGIKLMGLYLTSGCNPAYLLLQTSISSNVSGYTKKIFYTSSSLVFYTIGNFIGPLMLVTKEAPRYTSGLGAYIGANVLCIILFGYVRYTYVRRNKERNLDPKVDTVALPDELEDITDIENRYFVYRT
ncbi:hypothetical protein G6F61_000274 [Rhizopus arrhizus]|nr:hypothetical protein G6F61_000274 [Rhizopus arrhizus]